MDEEITITHEKNYIKVLTHGGGAEFARRLWSQIKDACNEHNCFSILGIGYTTELSTMEAFDHAALFRELGLSYNYRIAWVETNPEIIDIISFTETVLKIVDYPDSFLPTFQMPRNGFSKHSTDKVL